MTNANKISYLWRGAFSNGEIHALHAEAFQTRLYDESEWGCPTSGLARPTGEF